MLKQLLQAIVDRIKPCQHDWELLTKINTFEDGCYDKYPRYTTWIYRCKKCCKEKIITSK